MKKMSTYTNAQPDGGILPNGAFTDESSAGADDGTPIKAQQQQDTYYALYSILGLAGQTPNGTLESGDNKQVLGAMSQILNMKYNVLAEYSKGMLAWEIDSEVHKVYVSKEDINTGNALSNDTFWELVYSIGIDGTVTFENLVGGGKDFTFEDADLTSGVLTLSHATGQQYWGVTLISNLGKMVAFADDVEFTDANNMDIDMSSFGVLTGTWRVRLT